MSVLSAADGGRRRPSATRETGGRVVFVVVAARPPGQRAPRSRCAARRAPMGGGEAGPTAAGAARDRVPQLNHRRPRHCRATLRRVTILAGWREQYDRVRRSHDRLSDIAGGREHASSDEARDALIHFFQDGWHLADWIANDPAVSVDKSDIDEHVKSTQALKLCADLANGTKHFGLDPKRRLRTGDAATAITSQDVTVRPATVRARARVGSEPAQAPPPEPPRPALHAWRVTSDGQEYDALTLAADVVHEWQEWQRRNRLL